MDDSGEVVTTETRAARYVGGHAIDVAPVAQLAPGPGEVRIHVGLYRRGAPSHGLTPYESAAQISV